MLTDDKKFHKDLHDGGRGAARTPARRCARAPRRRSARAGSRRKLLLLGRRPVGLAVALSEDLRYKVLDALFGAEEEFDYTSTTAPSAAPTRA